MEREKKAILAAIGVYFFWGFTFLASKVAQEYVTPFVLLAYRFDLASLLLAIPVLAGKRKLCLKGKKWFPLILLGLLEPCLYFIGEQYGVRLTNSAFSGVMIAIIPIVTLIAAFFFLGEKPSLGQWLFSILSIAGIVVITLAENQGGSVNLPGFLCLLLAVGTGASYTVLNKRIADDYGVYERTMFSQLLGAAFFTVLSLIEKRNDLLSLVTPLVNLDFLAAIAYLAVFGSVLGYTLFNYAVANAPTAKVVVFCNLTTILSVLAGVFLLGEAFSLLSGVAMVAVLIGIWGVQRT